MRVRSLPARISLVVFVAALVTTVTVTMLSVLSMDAFLREEIDRKFPSILAASAEKIELWYDQRALEIGVFSSSGVVVENVDRMRGTRGRKLERARGEIDTYLAYVIESFPQYDALFVLDADGDVLASVGQTVALSPDERASLRSHAASDDTAPVYTIDGDRQVAFGAIRASDASRLGSIHGLIRTESLDSQLHSDDLGVTGEIYVIDAAGTLVLGHSPTGATADVLEAGHDGGLREYTKPSGERMVGAVLPFDRFGWTVVVEETYADAFAPSVGAVQRIVGINLVISAVLCAGALGFALSISRPIRALAEAAQRISNGERDVPIPAIGSRDEVGLLARTPRLDAPAAAIEPARDRTQPPRGRRGQPRTDDREGASCSAPTKCSSSSRSPTA